MKYLLFLLLSVSSFHSSIAQNKQVYFPKEGDTIPDYTFTNVINHSRQSLSIKDFRGKWLVMDWWTTGCLGCIKSFPKMSHLSESFNDRVNIMMVGLYGKRSSINGSKDFYLMKQKKDDLKMIAAFDSISFDRYAISSTPYILVVNPKGIIVAKTLYLDSAQLEGFITDKPLPYVYAYSHGEKYRDPGYNMKLPLLSTGKMANGGIDTNTITRSVFARWTPKMLPEYAEGFDEFAGYIDDDGKIKKCSRWKDYAIASGFDIQQLIKIAYIGRPRINTGFPLYGIMYPKLILETSKNSLFGEMNKKTGENMYSYAINYKNLTSELAKRFLKEDLERTFNFKTTIEKREVPIWTLVVIDRNKVNKIKAKGGEKKKFYHGELNGITFQSYPIDQIYDGGLQPSLITEEGEFVNSPIFKNKTDINFNVDLTIKADMTDLEDVRRSLRKVGLDIVNSSYSMDCIVVRDRIDN